MNQYQLYAALFVTAMTGTLARCSTYSIYSSPKNYGSSYLSPTGGIALTGNSSPAQQSVASSSAASANWALNQRLGAAGILNPFVGAAGESDIPIGPVVTNPDGTFVIAGRAATYADATSRLFLSRYLSNATLDTTFGSGGTFIFSFPSDGGVSVLRCYCSDGAGGYYVGGYRGAGTQGVIAHVTSTGTVDTSFGTNGFVQPAGTHSIVGIATQSTGGIVYVATTVGYFSNGFVVNRLTSTGTADTSFASSTASTILPYAMALDSQNRTLIVGTDATTGTQFYVYRVGANGGFDSTFNNGSPYNQTNSQGICVAVMSDNSIVVGGRQISTPNLWAIFKLTSSGTLDPSFGTNGAALYSEASQPSLSFPAGIVVLPGNQIATAGGAYNTGTSHNWYYIMLLNADGSLNPAFSIPGQSTPLGAGTAMLEIPAGTHCLASGIGYQGSVPDKNLIVVGNGVSAGAYGIVFYTGASAIS